MNIGFFIGTIANIDKFKFIYGDNLKHKSMIEILVNINESNLIKFRGYDDIADNILRNKYKFVFIKGILRTDGYIEIEYIKKL